VIAGAFVGGAATIFVTYFTSIHWLWYFVVGTIGGLTAGYILRFLRPVEQCDTNHAEILSASEELGL